MVLGLGSDLAMQACSQALTSVPGQVTKLKSQVVLQILRLGYDVTWTGQSARLDARAPTLDTCTPAHPTLDVL